MSNDYNAGVLQGLAIAINTALKLTRLIIDDGDRSQGARDAATQMEQTLLRIREDQKRLARLPV